MACWYRSLCIFPLLLQVNALDGYNRTALHYAAEKDETCVEILLEYGAYNAANLDGGSSSTFVLDGEILNHPCGPAGARYLPTGFIVR